MSEQFANSLVGLTDQELQDKHAELTFLLSIDESKNIIVGNNPEYYRNQHKQEKIKYQSEIELIENEIKTRKK